MSDPCHHVSRSTALWVMLTLASSCFTVPIQPMPPLPDLGRLKLAPADSENLAHLAVADSVDTLFCLGLPYEDTAGVVRPVMTRSQHVYPSGARQQGLQGWVALTFIIGVDGIAEPRSLTVLDASNIAFLTAARSTILSAVYTPARKNGKAVRIIARQVVEFRFKGAKS